MASFNIHLAIGKKYIEKNGTIKDEKSFYEGILSPDLVRKKSKTHYTNTDFKDKDNLTEYLKEKVILTKYLEKEYDNTEYQLGIFLHLVTDYLFFNDFLEKTYLSKTNYEDFCRDLYYSYDVINDYLTNEYKINYTNFISEIDDKNTLNETKNLIISIKKLNEFIEYVSSINLEEYKNKILSKRTNILPY